MAHDSRQIWFVYDNKNSPREKTSFERDERIFAILRLEMLGMNVKISYGDAEEFSTTSEKLFSLTNSERVFRNFVYIKTCNDEFQLLINDRQS